ncbi:hypothetical protein [Porphyromonas macacae]|uniref:hypothetical protein n=1 Tax=Porphyromonas macacae TaxID=28115 RepID=UPI000469FF31|nr:hypothetical protein [Porphyromonas macacae]
MSKNSFKAINSLLIFIVISVTLFISQEYSIFILFSLPLYFLGCLLSQREKSNRHSILFFFTIVLLICFFYAWNNNKYLEIHGNVLMYPDQIGSFGARISNVLNSCNSISELFESIFIDQGLYGSQTVINFYNGAIAILDRNLTGEYHFITLLIFNSYITTFTFFVVYKLFTRFLSFSKSPQYAFIFFLCSPMLMYAAVALRDMHMMLILVSGFYFISAPFFSWKNFIIALLLFIPAYYIREMTGVFYLVFVLAYYFFPQ